MSWNDTLAHKLTIDYWTREKDIRYATVLLDTQINQLGFYNTEISEDMRKNEMRIEAGALLKHFVELNVKQHDEGLSLDDAFEELVVVLTDGSEKVSVTGTIIDKVFKFLDEN